MARYVRVRRQGRMGYLDKETGRFTLKKPTTTTSTSTPKPKPAPSTGPKISGYKDNLKFLKDAVTRQQAAGMSAIRPANADAVSALMIGATLGELYRQTDRAPAVSNRGAGRATFNQGPVKRNYPVQIGKADDAPTREEKAEVKAEVEAAQGSKADSGFVASAPSEPTRDKVVKNRPMNTAETKAAGKDPMHVWALHNKQMILRNQNRRQLQILEEAEAAAATKPKGTMSGTTGGYSRSMA